MTAPELPPPVPTVKAPAICLIVLGSVALLCDACAAVAYGPMAPYLDEYFHETRGWMTVDPRIRAATVAGCLLFAAMSLVTLLGGVQMLRRRAWPLAMTGSVLAMLNFGGCCCAFGIPVGIWAMTVLTKEDVRAAFRAR